MTKSHDFRRAVFVGALLFALAPLVMRAQNPPPAAPGPRPITLDDYPRFKRIAGASISTDGKWMLYTVTPNEGDGTLFVKSLDTATAYEIPRGTGASFSDDAKWVGLHRPCRNGGRGGRGARGGGRGGAAGDAATPPARPFEVMALATGEDDLPGRRLLLLLAQRRVAPCARKPRTAARRLPRRRAGAAGAGAARRRRRREPESARHRPADAQPRDRCAALRRQRRRLLLQRRWRAHGLHGARPAAPRHGVYVMTMSSGAQTMLDAMAADYDQTHLERRRRPPRRPPRRQGPRQRAEGQRGAHVGERGHSAAVDANLRSRKGGFLPGRHGRQ